VQLQKPDKVTSLTPSHSEVRFVTEQELLDQLEKIKGLLANKHPRLTLAELFAIMAKLSLEKLEPKPPSQSPKKKVAEQGKENHQVPSKADEQADKQPDKRSDGERSVPDVQEANNVMFPTDGSVSGSGAGVGNEKMVKESRYIPVEVKRVVYQRDGGKCQYVDSVTGRKCNSMNAIQYDHVVPFAQGGPTTVENMRILCRIHNRIHAIESYGSQKMSEYMKMD